jgi:hypothetical protein
VIPTSGGIGNLLDAIRFAPVDSDGDCIGNFEDLDRYAACSYTRWREPVSQ